MLTLNIKLPPEYQYKKKIRTLEEANAYLREFDKLHKIDLSKPTKTYAQERAEVLQNWKNVCDETFEENQECYK